MDERYERQIIMPEIGEEGQKKISEARVIVIGTGGLGSPVLYYLAAAGVGTIGIVDFDVASLSNLNRQFLHFERDVDVLKVDSAYEKLSAFNSKIKLVRHNIRLTEENIDDILSAYDIAVDCVDNVQTRHLVHKHALALGMHIIEGGIEGCSGFVMTVKPGEACYGCLNPRTDYTKRKIPVLGTTAGVIGCIQASECLKVIAGYGQPLYSQILFIDLENLSFDKVAIGRSEICPCCGKDA